MHVAAKPKSDAFVTIEPPHVNRAQTIIPVNRLQLSVTILKQIDRISVSIQLFLMIGHSLRFRAIVYSVHDCRY